ncbi:MAG TPA: GerMN domain-containing protein [Desulfuromonadales bacterium]|nr:GerMN domain-containing protein [Desulfuromonadales bacterium]
MNGKIVTLSAFLIVLVMAISACEKNEQTRQSPVGTVKASPAYIENFGQPPAPDEGSCYARVGFFPLRDDPEKVRAVPFFLFRHSGQLQQLLERIVGAEMSLPGDSGLFNPFPEGTSVNVRNLEGDSVKLEVDFADRQGSDPELKAAAAALTETAVQYEGIERVIVLFDGALPPGAPSGGYRHDPARTAPVEAPVLFMIAASWKKGEAHPEEIAANFDRPVDIQSFHLEDAEGREILGDYFQSVFDMSVIIHPENPAAIREGMIMRAEWEVTDKLGRRGLGSGEFQLERYDHPPAGPALQ